MPIAYSFYIPLIWKGFQIIRQNYLGDIAIVNIPQLFLQICQYLQEILKLLTIVDGEKTPSNSAAA